MASSADGTKLVAASNGYTYASTDSGVTWTQGTTTQSWSGVASSEDGTKVVAAAFGILNTGGLNGYLYTSTDSGASWTQQTTDRQEWNKVASSADGTKLVAVATGGYIYTSSGPTP